MSVDEVNTPLLSAVSAESIDRNTVEEFFASIEAQLEEQKEAVRNSVKPRWEAFMGTYIESQQQLELITSYDNAASEQRSLIFDESGPELCSMLLRLLAKVKQSDVVKYLLVICDDLLEGAPVLQDQRVQTFLNVDAQPQETGLPASPFITLLDFEDAFVRYISGKLASLFVWKMRSRTRERDVDVLVRWIISQLQQRNDPYAIRSAVKALQYSLQNPVLRPKFFAGAGLDLLAPILSQQHGAVLASKAGKTNTDRDLQLVYETIFCVWLLSYNEKIALGVKDTRLIWWIVKLCQEIDNEKVRRISFATLRNLSGKGENDEQMIHAGFAKMLKSLLAKRWGDEDITNDLEFLADILEQKMLDMTTFDRYRQEVLSGELEWSPVHKSERFWKENVHRLGERNYELVGVLSSLLESNSEQTQSIACYDLGEFARFHTKGKRVLHEHNIKTKIMALIDSQDTQVQQQSLLALQKIMIHNWKFV